MCPRGQGTLVVFSCLVSTDETWEIWKLFKVQNTAKNQALCLNLANFIKKSLQIWRIWGMFSPKHPLYEWQAPFLFLSPCGKISSQKKPCPHPFPRQMNYNFISSFFSIIGLGLVFFFN